MGGFSRDQGNTKIARFFMGICFSFAFIAVLTAGVDVNVRIGARVKVLGLMLKGTLLCFAC